MIKVVLLINMAFLSRRKTGTRKGSIGVDLFLNGVSPIIPLNVDKLVKSRLNAQDG